MDGKKDRFTALDSWRGICAIIVVIHHFLAGGHFLFLPFFRNSGLFVDFFFVLSGFVITHAYQSRLASIAACAAFAIRRLGRVWPLHVVMLMPFIATELIKLTFVRHGVVVDRPPFSGPTSLGALVANIFLVQSMGVLPDVSWNTPSWSISVEYWAYILFGSTVLVTSKAARSDRWRELAFGVMFALSLVLLVVFANTLLTIANLSFARCVVGFLGGHFAYQLWERLPDVPHATTAEISLVLFVVIFVTLAAGTKLVFLAPLIFGLAVVLFAQERGALSALLQRPVCRFVGRVSFSIYLTHLFLFDTFQKVVAVIAAKSGLQITQPVQIIADSKLIMAKVFVFGGPYLSDLLLIVFLAVVLAVSAFTYRWVEKPGQRLFNNLARRVPHSESGMAVADPRPL